MLVHAQSHHELVARALLALADIQIADVAVEGRLGPAAVEIDAQKTFGRMVVGLLLRLLMRLSSEKTPSPASTS